MQPSVGSDHVAATTTEALAAPLGIIGKKRALMNDAAASSGAASVKVAAAVSLPASNTVGPFAIPTGPSGSGAAAPASKKVASKKAAKAPLNTISHGPFAAARQHPINPNRALVESRLRVAALEKELVTSQLTAVYWQQCAVNLSQLIYGQEDSDLVPSPAAAGSLNFTPAATDQAAAGGIKEAASTGTAPLPLPLINPFPALAKMLPRAE